MGVPVRALGIALAIALCAAAAARAFTLGSGATVLGWRFNELGFYLNPSGCSIPQAEIETAMDIAFGLWNSVGSSRLRLFRNGTVTTTVSQALAGDGAGPPSPMVLCDTGLTATIGADSNSIPAATASAFSGDDRRVDYAILLLNSESGKSANIRNLSATKLAIILAHEIGHALGLGHTTDTTALMYFDATEKTELGLSQDDIDGITFLYPRQEPALGEIFGCGAAVDRRGAATSPGAAAAAAWPLLPAYLVTRRRMRRPTQRKGDPR